MKHILICEDEQLSRQGIRKVIERDYADVVITECENGLEGYKQLSMERFDLVISDIKMPHMNGLEMLERAAAGGYGAPTVLISAYSEFEYAKTAMKYGVKDYLLKPVNHFELLDCLKRLLGDSDAQAGAAEAAPNKGEADSIELALSFIEQNFFRNISLEDVSKAAFMNPSYFSARFKKQTGMKYIDYLTKLRLEKADNLLRCTMLQINEIAGMVGYTSTKHFTRLYREKYGVLPNERRAGRAVIGENAK